ncbi:ATP synthase protein I [Nymphon striatum]|nr:ATP synthase protein I [Nymphon striatum]
MGACVHTAADHKGGAMGIAVARSGGLDNGTDQLGTAHKGEVKDDPEEQTAAHEGEARGEIGPNIEQADGKEDERGAGDKHGEPDRVVLDNQLLGGVSGDFHDCDYAAGFGVRQVGDTRWLLYFRTLQWKIPAICSLTHRAAPMDNWDEIRTAFQVARMGTVSGAAEVLGVHHATVIRHIDALEGRLGVKLFQRHARGYTATEAGNDLLRVAQATDDQFAQLAGRIKGRGTDVSGELVVTSLVALAAQIAPILAAFQRQHRDVSVRYLTGDRLFRLEYGEAHVAIRAGVCAGSAGQCGATSAGHAGDIAVRKTNVAGVMRVQVFDMRMPARFDPLENNTQNCDYRCNFHMLTLQRSNSSYWPRIPMGNCSVSDQDLQELEAKINAAKARSAPAKPHQEEHYSQAQLAWRMVIELVAGLGIGFGIGYGLDVLFGTLPIFMVLFVMLGLAAGVKTMLRSAQEIQDKKIAEEAKKNEGA